VLNQQHLYSSSSAGGCAKRKRGGRGGVIEYHERGIELPGASNRALLLLALLTEEEEEGKKEEGEKGRGRDVRPTRSFLHRELREISRQGGGKEEKKRRKERKKILCFMRPRMHLRRVFFPFRCDPSGRCKRKERGGKKKEEKKKEDAFTHRGILFNLLVSFQPHQFCRRKERRKKRKEKALSGGGGNN